MSSSSSVQVSCLCGNTAQTVVLRSPQGQQISLSLCHCDTCRHVSGLLCTSYAPIDEPASLNSTRKYEAKDSSSRYFCSNCGCHVFRWSEAAGWGVATGVMKGPGNGDESQMPCAAFERHEGVADTKDGGIARWITAVDGKGLCIDDGPSTPSSIDHNRQISTDTLPGSCACGTVSFHMTRPDEASLAPHSNFPDLMVPYCTTAGTLLRNPADEKWWLQDGGTKYLAGTCACRSCRLTSGFEIQTWAFIPRTNIFFHTWSTTTTTSMATPLDFHTLPAGILQGYGSSPGVRREFCGTCGATVFWHDEDRPGVVDVSVGLLRAGEGARAETWLSWWTGRVSFREDAERDRWGGEARGGRVLVDSLAEGLGA